MLSCLKRFSFIIIYLSIVVNCSTSHDFNAGRTYEVCKTCPKFSEKDPLQYLFEIKKKISAETNLYMHSYLKRDLFLKATILESRMNFKAAESYYEFLHRDDHKDLFLLRKLALNLTRNGNLEKASVFIRNNIDLKKKLDSESGELGVLLGNILESLGSKKEAIEFYEELMVNNSHILDGCLRLSDLYSGEMKFQKSIKTLKTCKSSQEAIENKAEIDFKLGRKYLDLNDINNSEAHFLQAYSTYPESSKSLAALAVIYEETDRQSKYISMFQKHLKTFPDDYLILSRLLDHYVSNENYSKAIVYLEKMSDLNSSETDLKFKLAFLYRESKNNEKAIETLGEIIEVQKDVGKAYYFLADLYFEQGQTERAYSALEKIPMMSSFYADGTIRLANKYRADALSISSGRSLASVEDKSQKYSDFVDKRISKKNNPKLMFDLYLHKALYFEKVKKFSKAASLLSEVEDNPLFEDKHAFYLASLYEKSNHFSKADKVIEKMIEEDPIHAEAHNYIGYALLERGKKLKKAKKHIERAVEIQENDPHILDSLGWLRYHEGNYKDSIKYLLKANELLGGDPTVLTHLAQAYMKVKKFHEARQCLEEAQKRGVSDVAEKKKIQNLLSRLPASN